MSWRDISFHRLIHSVEAISPAGAVQAGFIASRYSYGRSLAPATQVAAPTSRDAELALAYLRR
jgi:hypothetical protein